MAKGVSALQGTGNVLASAVGLVGAVEAAVLDKLAMWISKSLQGVEIPAARTATCSGSSDHPYTSEPAPDSPCWKHVSRHGSRVREPENPVLRRLPICPPKAKP